MKWSELCYWRSGEWQVIEEKLKDEQEAGYRICPERKNLFKALDMVPFEKVRVCILGQDPYPNEQYATGIPFSVQEGEKDLPASLRNMFSELVSDIGISYPGSGELSKWCKQGVLLWNVYPSCRAGKAGSHHWPEWAILTQEIVEKLDDSGHVVFCLLGRIARHYRLHIHKSSVIETSHPSPLGANKGFLGSRIYSRINTELGDKPIDWIV